MSKFKDKLALFRLTMVIKKLTNDELTYVSKVIDNVLAKRKKKGIKVVR